MAIRGWSEARRLAMSERIRKMRESGDWGSGNAEWRALETQRAESAPVKSRLTPDDIFRSREVSA